MSCAAKTFTGITRADFSAIIAELAKTHPGIEPAVVKDVDSASADGYTLAWNFNEALSALSVQCTSSPWYAPCSSINDAITETVQSALTPTTTPITTPTTTPTTST
jgi:hypothetical protein